MHVLLPYRTLRSNDNEKASRVSNNGRHASVRVGEGPRVNTALRAFRPSIIHSLNRSRTTNAGIRIVCIILDKLRRRVCVPLRSAISIVWRLGVRRISHHRCRSRGRCYLWWRTGIKLMRCRRPSKGWDKRRRRDTRTQRRWPRGMRLSVRRSETGVFGGRKCVRPADLDPRTLPRWSEKRRVWRAMRLLLHM